MGQVCGSKSGSDRFVKVKEVKNGVLHCDDLAANKPRNFSIAQISDVRMDYWIMPAITF